MVLYQISSRSCSALKRSNLRIHLDFHHSHFALRTTPITHAFLFLLSQTIIKIKNNAPCTIKQTHSCETTHRIAISTFRTTTPLSDSVRGRDDVAIWLLDDSAFFWLLDDSAFFRPATSGTKMIANDNKNKPIGTTSARGNSSNGSGGQQIRNPNPSPR